MKDLLAEVEQFSRNVSAVWFRGQRKYDEKHKLHSSLFRENLKSLKGLLNRERGYYNLFKNLGHMYHNEDDWNLLFLMQHYGVHTRLLDWTESFAVALFFATRRWDKTSPASIWMLKPADLNKKSIGKHGFCTITGWNYSYRDLIYTDNDIKFHENSVALHPIRNSSRIIAQQGVFTMQGNLLLPLEEEFNGELINEGILKRLEINPALSDEIDTYLKLAGINWFVLFPDLEGLAKHLNEVK